MKSISKAAIGALALAGSVVAIGTPANAQSVYFGVNGDGGGNGYYGGYSDSDQYADPSYADPYNDAYADTTYGDQYSCQYYDYYNPPWGYPPDYCNYQVWSDPVYFPGGLWYGGPIYYRSYGGANWFWLNGGWRRDEWRGARPARIDWARNRYWGGQIHHQPNSRGVWNGRQWNGRGFVAGNSNRGNFQGRSFNGGNAFAGRNWNGNDGQRFGGDRGRDFANRNNGQNFVAPRQNNGGDRGNFRGRVGGDFGNRGGAPAFAQQNATPPNTGRFMGRAGDGGGFQRSNAPGNSAVHERAGGPAFRASGPQGGGGGGNRGGEHQSERGHNR